MIRISPFRMCVAVFPLLLHAFLSSVGGAYLPGPITYTIRVVAPETHVAEIEATFPTGKRPSVEVMMAKWSPGFYRIEDYAGSVQDLSARVPGGRKMKVERTRTNRWRIQTHGAATITVNYRLSCERQSVTTNWVGPDYAVFNGPATYITLVEKTVRPQEVRLELPSVWRGCMTSLDLAADGQANHFRAPDFDVLADSPIVAGNLSIHEFDVAGSKHYLVDFGDVGQWEGQQAARNLQQIVAEHERFLGGLPYKKYVFLNGFRRANGGLEHLNSTLLTSSPTHPASPTLAWVKFVSHEYFHAINVKRLRPIELGPFDYENPPRTPSLWISEGLTTYYGDLAVSRSGVGNVEDFLAGVSSLIRQLQTCPGRLVQSLEQSSLDVWTGSTSGYGGDPKSTVSYYVKGPVVGFLLDARIRHLTDDARSLDDVMRQAYATYSGERGFKPQEFQKIAAKVAGADLTEFFTRALRTTKELDYSEMLDWFGLRFAPQTDSTDPVKPWTLEIRPDSTDAQNRHFRNLMAPSP
jgi:predicted metalloprotease with PDZ domain